VFFYLVRHGNAVTAAENPGRPLSPAGRAGVERIAQLACERDVKVSLIHHSGILRAQATAEILARYLMPPLGVERLAGLLPEDDPVIAMAELEEAKDSIMLVGHLPHLNRLAALLVAGDPDRTVIEFSPATMVCCAKASGRWKIDWKLAPPPN
jgi:phosphohistidine phosphatase